MKRIRIAAIGDSLVKGVVLTDKNRYSVLEHNFMDLISEDMGLYIENYAKFGSTVNFGHNVIERHGDDISSSDYTFIEYGGNDCDFNWMEIADAPQSEHQPKTVMESFKNQFVDLVRKVKELGSKPIILSLPPIDSDLYFSFISRFMSQEQKENVVKWLGGDVNIISRWHESYNRSLFDISEATGTPIIDITSPFEKYKGKLSSLYCSDGIHPNQEGHRLIATAISNMYL